MMEETIKKLQKVYNANLNVPEEQFNMRQFSNECGTQGCLVGNAIVKDSFFKENGLSLKKLNWGYGFPYIPVLTYEDGNYETGSAALEKFFELEEDIIDEIFYNEFLKETALNQLQVLINQLKDNYYSV